ncbi:MAG: T9SS type A sorting domain-containing protein [bacterium]|nr:T9SS type A sorting domain-containing protein [bacterium]
MWRSARTSPTSGGSEAAVFGERAYLWEASPQGPKVTAFDLTSGARLYSSRGIGGGFIQQLSLLIGPNGTIYAPRTQNNVVSDSLVALQDNGTSFQDLWRVPLGFVPFGTLGIGPDGSVYSYSREFRVLRLNPLTGATLDSSQVIESDFYQPRMAIDTAGVVFLTNGGFSQGKLLSFDANLQFLWDEEIPNVNIGNPAIGQFGHMIVCGTGTDVRCFRGRTPNTVRQRPAAMIEDRALSQNFPNPFNATTLITYELPSAAHVTLSVFDALGRQVATLLDGVQSAGEHTVRFDGAGLASGAYYCHLVTATQAETIGMIMLK